MPPKTHDLTQLGAPLAIPEALTTSLRALNPLFATTRYPDAANGVPAKMFDDEIARARFAEAEEVIA